MKITSIIFCSLLAAASTSVLADSPTGAATPAVAAPPAATAPPAAAAVAAPAATSAAAPAAVPVTVPVAATAATASSTASADSADLQKWARNHGYKPSGKGGNILWCSNDAPLGSRLDSAHPVCHTESTLAEIRRTYEQNKQDMMRMTQSCSGMSCGKN